MSSHNLEKDNGVNIYSVLSAGGIAVLIVGMYVVAYMYYIDRPHHLVSMATTAAIALSLVLAAVTPFFSVQHSAPGEASKTAAASYHRGLTMAWVTSAISLGIFLCAAPVTRVSLEHTEYVITAGVVLLIMAAAHWMAKPKAEPATPASHRDAEMINTLTLPAEFKQSVDQRPAFQVTMVDLTRLIIHQAGRTIAYRGSNCLFDDSFSIELDINARTSKIFSETNLVNTAPFLYWRMHMLLMGSAAEKVLTGSMSEAALDDIHQFDDLAARFLMLGENRTFNAKPINEAEAALKAGRINTLRKNVWSRCMAAARENRNVLGEVVSLMRKRPCLTYSDIRRLLERVKMPEDFPVAQFDSEDTVIKGVLENHSGDEVTLKPGENSMFATQETVIFEQARASSHNDRVTNLDDHRKTLLA
ncbi:hypothetical protein QAO71_17175 (plasmid) [Halopseudomonas sp. SMJS2]|uniref:hypothetical protein n=1 Tax=Halopseudomonas sp. SMJS2 TaxID=3041098 RepID=UPI00245309EB|nr:hypothetical protein [Halopseudomonas sp. SMJS2]WGK63500.1 hypothetical protein QAO71_17175 [Halopseudomonas sp. SMJS2]